MTKTQKIGFIASQLGITPRTVWTRLKEGRLSLDQFEFPADKLSDQEGYRTVQEAPDQPVPEIHLIPAGETGADRGETLAVEAEQLRELQEQVKWLSAQNHDLKLQIGLLEVPKAESDKLQAENPRPGFIDRLRAGWQVFLKGNRRQQLEG